MTIRLDNVRLQLGVKPVLHGISSGFSRGKVTAILGPNGAGKTSLLKIMCGLLVPDSGTATLDGESVGALERSKRARKLGYLPQESSPVWNLKARDLVALGRLPHRTVFAPGKADAAAIDNAMADTDTAQFADRQINALSGGERARVQFARVLAGEPDWILADEPLANLDPAYQQSLLALLRTSANGGKGVVVVLHGLNAAARTADEIVLLRDGQIIAAGPKQIVLTQANLATAYGITFDISLIDGHHVIRPTG